VIGNRKRFYWYHTHPTISYMNNPIDIDSATFSYEKDGYIMTTHLPHHLHVGDIVSQKLIDLVVNFS